MNQMIGVTESSFRFGSIGLVCGRRLRLRDVNDQYNNKGIVLH